MSFGGTVVSFPTASNPLELWLDYCAERGLTPDMLSPMNGELLAIDQAAKIMGTGIFGLKSIGAVGAFVFPLGNDEFQARMIYDPAKIPEVGKPGETARPAKITKYFRPKHAAGVLYVPPHLTDWYADVSYNLLIVEGALNAVRLAAEGYHAVAITGVFNYRLGGKGTAIIPELRRLVESRQVERVTFVPDSDTGDQEQKRELWNGVHSLCQDLMKLRPSRRDTIYICRPHSRVDGSKNGPDDYLHSEGLDEFNRLLREESQRYSDNPYLHIEQQAIDQYIYDRSSEQFWDEKLRIMIKKGHFDSNMMLFGMVDDITSDRPKKVNYDHKRFLNAPNRRVAESLRFRPDLDDAHFCEETEEGPKWYINKHSPFDIPKAIKGDCSIAYEMLSSLCRDSPSAIQKILTVAARHAQYPAGTPKFALLFTGEQRAGKSNFARLIGTSLSKRYHDARVDPSSDFTALWRGFACKEWAELDARMDEEWLKDLITARTYTVNAKYGTQYEEPNYTLNIFTCNSLKSKIQEGDGRFVIAGYAKPDDKRLGLAFEEWVKGPGPSHFRYHLLNDVDASHYDQLDVRTEMRDAVIAASKSYKASVKDELLDDLSDMPELECVPVSVLQIMLEPHRVVYRSFINEFGQYFPIPALEKVKIDGKPVRFRAFKNLDRWHNETDTDKYREQALMAEKFILKGHKY